MAAPRVDRSYIADGYGLLAAYAKYVPTHGYRAEASNWEAGIWRVRPRKVLGWGSFPADSTRWTFERG